MRERFRYKCTGINMKYRYIICIYGFGPEETMNLDPKAYWEGFKTLESKIQGDSREHLHLRNLRSSDPREDLRISI